MKQIDGKEARKGYLITFVSMWHLWIVLGLISGCIAGVLAQSFIVFLFFCISVPLFLNYLVVIKFVKKVNSNYEYMAKSLQEKLNHVDYYNVGEQGAIAVDIKAKQIAIINVDKSLVCLDPFTISSSNILRCFSNIIDPMLWYSSKSTTTIDMAQENIKSKSEAYEKTGIYFEIDDIMRPKAFVQMAEKEIDGWMLVLNKFFKNSLDGQSEPMLYPQTDPT